MRRAVAALDEGSVRPFHAMVYLAYIAAGVQSLALGAPPNAVAQVMGHRFALAWIVLIIVSPALALVGMATERRYIYGLYMQAAGNSGVACATAAYVMAILQVTWADRASFAAWMATSLTASAVLITWRDVRRIRAVTRRVRQLEEDA
ncbi:hypothetical protein IU469_22315 [Nocardia puris]|uniref:hypothetical protein n=1 Tax=Nocardia puris TaxID=208602 RepID=UPI0018930F37|nr:hypothetical protein [Nocardia puris]MBF6368435.1 hypothetical protein [Nocardia puris]